MTLGLVLSGGGVRGAAHIGVLKSLHEENIKPVLLSGTSAGSIVAGLYSYGYSPDEISLIARQLTRKYYDIDYNGIISSIFHLLFTGSISTTGLLKGDMLENMFSKLTKGTCMGEAKIPTAITAVDINNANIVIFTSFRARLLQRKDYVYLFNRPFSEAIRSSIAIPGIFQPKMIDSMRLVDGGVRDNLPVDIIRLMGARKVIAVNLAYGGNPVPEVDNIVEISLQAIQLMMYQINRCSLEAADIVISPKMEEVSHGDLSKIDSIIQSGYRATKEMMPKIKRLLKY